MRFGTTIRLLPGLSVRVSLGVRGPGVSFSCDPGVMLRHNRRRVTGKQAAQGVERGDVASALVNSGFKKPQVDRVLGVLRARGEDDGTFDEVLRRALKELGP